MSYYKFYPVFIRMLIFGSNYLYLIPAVKHGVEGNYPAVHLCSYTMITYLRVNIKSKINRSRIERESP